MYGSRDIPTFSFKDYILDFFKDCALIIAITFIARWIIGQIGIQIKKEF